MLGSCRNPRLQPVEPLSLSIFLRIQRFDGLSAGVDHRLPFDAQFRAPRFDALRLVSFSGELRLCGTGRVERPLCGDLEDLGLLDTRCGSGQACPFGLDPARFFVQTRLLLTQDRQSRFQQFRCLRRLLAERADFFQSEQVCEQGLDLCVLVGSQLTFTLRRKHGRKECLGAAADGFNTPLVRLYLAIGHRAVLQRDGFPARAILCKQEGLGLALAV